MMYILIGAGVLLVLVFLYFLGKKEESKAGKVMVGTIAKIDQSLQSKTVNEVVAAEFAAGRIPVLYFWASWCGPSIEFKESLPDPLMQDALNNVTLIVIDTDADAEKEQVATRFNVRNIPTFIRLDNTGKFIKKVDGGAWAENIPANMAPVLKAFINS